MLQSLILNPWGSPLPGAIECLINMILLPSKAGFQLAEAKDKFENINNKMMVKNTWGTMVLIMVDEKKVLQIYVA